ncbi:MAG: AAA family ATPase [Epsilonproteobacteria bacterium]|nr:AAA family ATPase [Campylobacterota bacterium]
MIRTFLNMDAKRLKTIALLFGVLIIIVIIGIFKNNNTTITRGEVKSLDKNGSITKVIIDGNYLYLNTKNKSYRIYKDAIDYKDFFDKYPVEIKDNESFSLSWNILLFFMIGFALFYTFSKKKAVDIFKTGRSAFKGGEAEEKNEYISPMKTDIRFKDVAGISDVKEELEEIIDFLKNPKKYKSFDIRLPKGVLLVGPPGVGKTLIAKAVAGEADVPFFYQSGATFVNIYVGMGAKRVSSLFQMAKKNAPSIIFIDEIDAIGKSRGAKQSDEREATLNQLLTEMDGFEDSSGVIVIAATNKIDVLDDALLRAGRFDRRIFLSLPSIDERLKTLELYLSKKSHIVDVRELAKMSIGFNFASLSTWVNEAALYALRHNKRYIDNSDFEAVKDKVITGKSRFLTYDDEERSIQATYQAAKALLATWYDINFSKIGIAMQNFEVLDHNLTSKNSMINKIKVYLSGSIATNLKYKNIYSNSLKDIEQSKDLADKIINDFDLILQNDAKIEASEQILQTAKKETTVVLEKLDSVLNTITEHILENEFITQEEVREMLREIF